MGGGPTGAAAKIAVTARDTNTSIMKSSTGIEVTLGLGTAQAALLADVQTKDILQLPDRRPRQNDSISPLGLIKLEDIQLVYAAHEPDTYMRCDMGNIDIQVVTALHAAVRELQDSPFVKAAKKFKTSTPGMVSEVNLLYQIVQAAEINRAGNSLPAFAYESAYGLHVDDQRNIRRDPGWCMLSNMRQWYRALALPPSPQSLSQQAICAIIIERLAQFDDNTGADEALVRTQHFMESISPKDSVNGQRRTDNAHESKKIALFANVSLFRLQHFDRSVETQKVEPNLLVIEGMTAGWELSTGRRDASAGDRHRAVLALRSIQGDVRSSILPLALAVSRGKLPTASPNVSDTPSSGPVKDSIITVDVQIESSAFSIYAGDLCLRSVTKHTQATLSMQMGNSRDRQMIPTRGTLSSDGAEASVLQQSGSPDTSGQMVDRVVSSFRVEEMQALVQEATTSAVGPSKRWKAILGCKEIAVETKPHLRTLWMFMKSWIATSWP
jgi:hypothetical protein